MDANNPGLSKNGGGARQGGIRRLEEEEGVRSPPTMANPSFPSLTGFPLMCLYHGSDGSPHAPNLRLQRESPVSVHRQWTSACQRRKALGGRHW